MDHSQLDDFYRFEYPKLVGALPPGASVDGQLLHLPQPGRYRFVFGGVPGHVIALDGRIGEPASTPDETLVATLTAGPHELHCTVDSHAAAGERMTLTLGE